MEFRIEELDAFRIVGIVAHTTMKHGEGMRAISAMWGDVMQNGKNAEIAALIEQPPFGLLGASVYNTDAGDAAKFDYYIASSTGKPAPDGMAEYQVPAAMWAVFPCKREEIGKVEMKIVSTWQNSSWYRVLNAGYETGNMQSSAPDIEVYLQDGTAEVWVAVEKR